jgi:hypothetical protein
MISKYLKSITKKILDRNNSSRYTMNESSVPFVVNNKNMVIPMTCKSIQANDLIPGDIMVMESGEIFNINAIELNEDKLALNIVDQNKCERIRIMETNSIIGILGTDLHEDFDEDGSQVEIYEDTKRKVKLNKIMKGDVKKYKVYVKNDKGNVVKVNFGDPNMEIKRDDPGRRKNFRARHNCDNPGPRWKARYWACKTWSTQSVTSMLKEDTEPTIKPKQPKPWVERAYNITNNTIKNLNEQVYNPDLFGLIKNRTK